MITLLDCIERIPSTLNQIVNYREDNFSHIKEYLLGKSYSRLVIVGSGSSYNAAHASRSLFESLGIHVDLYYPNVFLNYTKQYDPKALYLFISQGGGTKLVYESIKKVKEKGYLNCSLTSDTNSPIAKLSDVTIDMICGKEEFLYRTLGFSSTVAVCMQLALVLSKKDVSNFDLDFRKMIDNLPIIKEKTIEWYNIHKFSLLKRNTVLIAGTNDLYPISNETDIKLMEMVPMLTRSFELEEFIHGPQNAFDDSIVYLILAKKGEDEEKAKAIAKFLKQEIGFCALIGNVGLDSRDLYFDVKSKYFSALEFVTVSQVLAYCWATDRGRDLLRPVNGVIKKYITKTIE